VQSSLDAGHVQRAQDATLALNELEFHYREWGDPAAQTLVLLHGVLAAAETYDALAAALATTRRVIALDQRGHGRTEHASDYSWPCWVDDLAAFWDALELDGADVVGHSMGANNAARFAGRHPDRVRRAVLVDGGFGPTNSPDADAYWAKVFQLFPADGFGSLDAYVDLALRLFPRASRSVIAEGTGSFVRDDTGRWRWPHMADLAVLAADPREPTAEEVRLLRAATTCPVLVVRAEHSELFTGNAFRATAAEYPDGRSAVLAACGHMIMWENVNGLVALVDDFLN